MLSLLAFSSLSSISPKLAAMALPLAQVTEDATGMQTQSAAGGAVGGLIGLLVGIVFIVSLWKIFTKAGQPGWASIVPIYNFYIMCKVAGKPGWWVLLMLIPIVNFIILILVMLGIANNFGKGTGFGLGLVFLNIIFLPILAFGDARYQGPTSTSPVLS